MPVELKIPAVGESVTEAFIGRWLRAEGQFVEKDQPVAELETDKANFELPAPVSGTLTKILKRNGESATIGEIIGYMEEGQQAQQPSDAGAQQPSSAAAPGAIAKQADSPDKTPSGQPPRVMPAAQRVLAQQGMCADQVQPTGPGGRVLKEDVLRDAPREAAPPAAAAAPVAQPSAPRADDASREEIVQMSPMRQTIARRLLEAQQNAALLTTFNEIDMSAVLELRKEHREGFEKRYGVRLGFMSFFVKAAIDALQRFRTLNAEIRGDKIVYKNYFDIGIAVSTDAGLVVPVLRDAGHKSFAEIEVAVGDLAKRARDRKLQLHELQGGTFTITNGGLFGSLLSTPIINPPQSGVLGMHAIQERPVVRDGQIVIRPMMYVALTYDHRMVDGREAVSFLKRIKESVEEPVRLLIEA